ncbi:type II secretion system protein GspK [Tuwongella immobilis]|uniref:General secretion pathway protein K n=1 Tax=Tuwongella immobilis TaxID=692036 RepID=A0A6C2YU14_9BACT|nr:type II secretion system protein GspK [Tuwongella immobilis]VIP04405.1 general secretion pathway protein k : Uncharacterized protein OS=Pirellula staleyi (strain ATCC 27377 / DSM 6068 / ICPB 4128) GN=Psta_3667 PE=4 SV=1: T2SK: T2SK [Tuwongella immobilis]VTS06172.1 general secretion pathway protein k : Uncharacterized protein OS=Pirellula staleyi (strain ATCC 27377 / DSM 6068 / ICPB 4128) GN=Psta_3667 PE=4 SV=1: T2SK: T2SK [Tuwongella immobilis]
MRRSLVQSRRQSAPRQSGFVLVAVLVVVVLLSLAAYQFSELMTAETRAANRIVRIAQARALAESGIHYAAAILADSESLQSVAGGNPFDNESAFKDVIVVSNSVPRLQGRFTLIAVNDTDDFSGTTSYRYGVTDEAARINLNTLLAVDSSGEVGKNLLLKLPNMSEEAANSILDWIDTDEEPRTGGAESTSYAGGSPSYRAKNGPLDSLEELLYVRNVTPSLLFGNDRNRNGRLDSGEDSTGILDRGWLPYLTIYSREQNIASDGTARIFLNDSAFSDLQTKLETAVGAELANYILLYRLYGGTTTMPSGQTRQGSSSEAASTVKSLIGGNPQAKVSISSLFDLVDSMVVVPGQRNAPSTVFNSPLSSKNADSLRETMPKLFDFATTRQDTELPGRININTVSKTVLAALPGLDETKVQSLIDKRPQPNSTESTDPVYSSPSWLISEANLDAATCRTLERYITTQTQVYRVQAVGTFDSGGPSARIEAVIDTNQGYPRIVSWRDLSELGKGFELSSSN